MMLTTRIHLLILFFILMNYISVDALQQKFPSTIDVSSNCQATIQRLSTLQSIHPQLMAQYWDSWGKPSDGIVYGHTTFLGYYDECMDLKNTPVGETNYCIYTMQMNITTFYNPSEYQDEVCYSSDCPVPINTSVSSNIQVGVCYPSTCSPNEFALVLSRMNIISVTSMTVNPFSNSTQTVTIQLTNTGDSPTFCPQTDVEFDMGAVTLVVFCGALVGLVILGTCLDIIWRLLFSYDSGNINKKDDDKEISISLSFILAFSLYKTVPDLLSTKQSPSSIKAVNSLKLFSNYCIIGSHVYIVFAYFHVQLSQNTPQYLDTNIFPSRVFNQFFMNTTFAVDTFFVVSATLSSYLTFKDIQKHKRFRVIYFYLHRYFRLAPLLYLATFVHFKLLVHFSQGPLWHSPNFVSCQSNWWYNLLFISNLLPVDDMCLVPTWFLGANMQLFIISPIFILSLYYAPLAGLVIITLCMAGSTIAIGVVSIKNGYWASIYMRPHYEVQFQWLHDQVHFRLPPYLTGIILGYILYKKYSIDDLPVRKSVRHLICMALWFVAMYLLKVTMFGTLEDMRGTQHFTEWENAIFLMFSGLAWSIGISIIIFFCNTGYGGVVNSVLSWPGWDPLIRLSYGVYLFHVIIIVYVAGTLQSSLIFTDTVFNMLWVFIMAVSYGFSILLYLVVEIPKTKVVSLCFNLAGINPRHI
ncbi:nose resistant to fluoxetine protein 6-like isoform X2 [Dysidea avara]